MVAGFLPTQALDLNDFGAQARQHLRTPRSRLMAAQVDDADAMQRPFDICHMRHSLLSAAHHSAAHGNCQFGGGYPLTFLREHAGCPGQYLTRP